MANGQTSVTGKVILGNGAWQHGIGGTAKPSSQNPDETDFDFGWKVRKVTTSFSGQLDPQTGQYSGTYVMQEYVYSFPEPGWFVDDRGDFSLQKQ